MIKPYPDLAEWMGDSWYKIPDDDPLAERVFELAGCSGRLFGNRETREIVLCDAGDLVLFSWQEWRDRG